MIKELLYKWFGLDPFPCATCQVLALQLDESNRERTMLLNRLLDKDKPESPSAEVKEEMKPLGTQFVPWRVRQQMLESEDRKTAELMRNKQKEIESLEKELGIG